MLRARSHLYHLVRQRSKALVRYVGIYSPTLQPEAAFAFSSERARGAWSDTLRRFLRFVRRQSAIKRASQCVVLPADPQTSPKVADLYKSQFQFRFDDDFAAGEVQRRICSDLRERDIECIDPLPLFRAQADQQLFLRVYGLGGLEPPNSAGHSLLAMALFEAISPRILPDSERRPRHEGNREDLRHCGSSDSRPGKSGQNPP